MLNESENSSDAIALAKAVNRASGRTVVPVLEPEAGGDEALRRLAEALLDAQERCAQGPTDTEAAA